MTWIEVSDIGTPRPDPISPISEGIPLLEAERIPVNANPAMVRRRKR
jgi:hypothetical protein